MTDRTQPPAFRWSPTAADDAALELALLANPNLWQPVSREKKRTVRKSVNGEDVSNSEFSERIINAVTDLGAASPAQVADDLGADPEVVGQKMRHMCRRKLLERVERGTYKVSSSCQLRLGRMLEASCIDTLRAYGGLAEWGEVMADFGALPSVNKYYGRHGGRAGRSAAISKAMKASKKIVCYESVAISKNTGTVYSKNMWGLPWDELLKIPLTGRNAEFVMTCEFVNISHNRVATDQVELSANITKHFELVGLAFERVRGMFDLDMYEVAGLPKIAKALEWIKDQTRFGGGRFYDQVRRSAETQAADEGRAGDVQYVETLRDAKAENVLSHVLAQFESGDKEVHRIAPVALYYAYAAEFGICAASLSRGLVARPLTEVALPDGWERLPAGYGSEP